MTNAQDMSNEILNEIETDAVLRFKADPLMFSAVKKYILAVAYKHGVTNAGQEYNGTLNFALNLAWGATQGGGKSYTDEDLGQNLRAMTYATQLLEGGFKEIAEMEKLEPEPELTTNPTE